MLTGWYDFWLIGLVLIGGLIGAGMQAAWTSDRQRKRLDDVIRASAEHLPLEAWFALDYVLWGRGKLYSPPQVRGRAVPVSYMKKV